MRDTGEGMEEGQELGEKGAGPGAQAQVECLKHSGEAATAWQSRCQTALLVAQAHSFAVHVPVS